MARKDKEIEPQHALFGDLVSREADYMARVCAGIYPGDAEMQTELMQQATTDLLAVLQRWQRGNGFQPMPKGYFHRTWQNLCKRHYNSHRLYQQRHCSLPSEMEAPDVESVSRFQQLYDIMNHLPPQRPRLHRALSPQPRHEHLRQPAGHHPQARQRETLPHRAENETN